MGHPSALKGPGAAGPMSPTPALAPCKMLAEVRGGLLPQRGFRDVGGAAYQLITWQAHRRTSVSGSLSNEGFSLLVSAWVMLPGTQGGRGAREWVDYTEFLTCPDLPARDPRHHVGWIWLFPARSGSDPPEGFFQVNRM